MNNKLVRLNLGSGIVIKKNFINVDIYEENDLKNHTGVCGNSVWEKGAKYIKSDIRSLPFDKEYADYVEMFEVLEHLPFRDIVPTLKEIHRVMKKGATLLLHCPNFNGLVRDWIDIMTNPFDVDRYIDVMETIYGNQLAKGEFHQCALTPQFMDYCLGFAGFNKGKMFVVPKYAKLPAIGSEKFNPKSVARYDILVVEITK